MLREYHLTKFADYEEYMAGWISFSDIGETFHGQTLTQTAYEAMEGRFLDVIALVFRHARPVYAEGLEDAKHLCPFVCGAALCDEQEIRTVARSCLRGEYWCRLESEGAFVHFGGDYDLYIGCSSDTDAFEAFVADLGLNLTEAKSEYAPQRKKAQTQDRCRDFY